MASGSPDPDPTEGNKERSPTSKRRRAAQTLPVRNALAIPSGEETERRSSASSQRTTQRSPSPAAAMGPVKLTKTGRVSRAAKGQRVHRCDVCDKVYTRAEHLRRHRQNHQPGSFLCDVPGCKRTFNREDLLARHKTRHDDPLNQPSRRASITSRDSPGPSETSTRTTPQPAASSASSSAVQISISQSTVPSSAGPSDKRQAAPAHREGRRKDYIPIRDLRTTVESAIDVRQPNPEPYFIGPRWQISPPSSEDEYEYDPPFMYSQPLYPTSHLLHTSGGPFQYANSASIPPISLATIMPFWTTSSAQLSTPSSETSYGHLNGQDIFTGDQAWHPTSGRQSLEERDALEQEELLTPMVGSSTHTFHGNSDSQDSENQYRYLDVYWHVIHPIWPIVHRPTFESTPTSPLLLAAMMAFGAHSSADQSDKSTARFLHERCVKVLKKRTVEHTHTFRVCDIQAAVLVELYSLFKSRRPPSQLSKPFEDVYACLTSDPIANSTSFGFTTDPCVARYEHSGVCRGGVEQQCRQRALACYFMLDQQQAALFGRPRCYAVSIEPVNLAYPSPQHLWDAELNPLPGDFDYDLNQHQPRYTSIDEALLSAKSLCDASEESCDAFTSMLLLTRQSALGGPSGPPALTLTSATSRIYHHTLALCKNTPICDLLAVAGESWIMASKLPHERDYIASQCEIRNWTASALTAQSALAHALEILKAHRECPSTLLLFHDWSLHLAVLVLWACAYAAESRTARGPRLSIPRPPEPRRLAHLLERTVDCIIEAGEVQAPGLGDVGDVLLWVKARLESRSSGGRGSGNGLMSGAVDVLGTLCKRGTEAGWF